MQRESNTPRPSQKPALRLAALLLGAGTMHFVAPKFFDSTVPTQLPGEARTYTYVSGVAELAIGTALAVPRTRRLGGGLAALLFVAVFPANVNMAVDWLKSSKTTNVQKAGVLLRLPLQIPLVTESLKARRQA
ncbi:putative membrane protein [Rhodococcus wratislaviensis]|uniref:Predicted membrane protein n=1 Tax=Rhodococcus wratislaviensis TaxID=44752 RepID=A0AB38FB23_RHOWR|nr:MauE/DoxX family redox-associated membrane protein [Rhodococcus wratislaviensis]REE72016.1 putative membrane protein [Rhodococcus wratislaviensis]SPZ38492.1 Predicted membrane protein [Rhodococcus wratislaviensis]